MPENKSAVSTPIQEVLAEAAGMKAAADGEIDQVP